LDFGGIGGIIGREGSKDSIMKNGRFHPGITIHKIPVGAGFAGLTFTIGSLTIFLVGLPVLWYFLVGTMALGVGFAFILRLTKPS
jgi:hypothetical protein